MIGAEEKLGANIRQHYIINEDGYLWILSFNNAREIYGSDSDAICNMTLWCKEDDKMSLYIDIDTDNNSNASGFGDLADLRVWLFTYCQDIPVEFECFREDIYPQRKQAILKKYYYGEVYRDIYKFDHKTEEGLSRYNIYSCRYGSDEMTPDGYQDIAL